MKRLDNFGALAMLNLRVLIIPGR